MCNSAMLNKALGRIYDKITSETKCDKVSFYLTDDGWAVTCKAQGVDAVEFNVTNDQMLSDDYHDVICGLING